MAPRDHYKHRIEEIVHPIAASHRRKNTMRRELWAGYTDLVKEEGDDESGCERAWVRMGDPAELRAELMASVPTESQSEPGWFQPIRKHPNDLSIWLFFRLLKIVGIVWLVCIVVSLVILWLRFGRLPLLTVAYLLIVEGSFFFWLLCLQIKLQTDYDFADSMQRQSRCRFPALRIFNESAGSMIVALLTSPFYLAFGLIGARIVTRISLGAAFYPMVVDLWCWAVLPTGLWVFISATLYNVNAVIHARVIRGWPYQ